MNKHNPNLVLCISGPLHQPNERFQGEVVEVLPHNFYRVKRLGTGEILTLHEHNIVFPKPEIENVKPPIIIEPAP